MVVGIVPKNKAKGVNFCGVDQYFYIVRSDLNCYMRSTDFHQGTDLEVFSLHPSCIGGDHYLAHKDDLFYIIKGNSYRRVSNLNKDLGAVVYTLHAKCQGGDFYLSAWDYFYIIFQEQGIYRRTSNMNSYEDGVEYTLHPDCKNGLYYFGTKDYCYIVKPHDEWGIQYVRITDLHRNLNAQTFSFHPDVVNFLPGGLGITKGPSHGEWVCIKTISNESQIPINWQKITMRVGYEKCKMSCVERNWKVPSTFSPETGGFTALITKGQFSLTVEYGGSCVNTEQESWSEVTEIEKTISLILQPNEKVYIWAYQLCLGKEPVLHCRDMRILHTEDPPTDIPLPTASD